MIDTSVITENSTALIPGRFGPGRDSSDGGGVYTTGDATIVRSTISGNATADATAGAFLSSSNDYYYESFYFSGGSAGGGGGIYNRGRLTIAGSSIVDNHTGDGGAGGGGGDGGPGGGILSAASGELTIELSTISGNSTGARGEGLPRVWCDYTIPGYGCNFTDTPDGADGDGSAIMAEGLAEIRGATITNNSAAGGGFGVKVVNLTVTNTIIAGNEGVDISGTGSVISSGGFNLIGDGAANGAFGGSDLVGIDDPRLAPLADNGGPTPTHALLPGSLAVNAGDPLFVPPPEFDQRGDPFDRVVGGRVDIGSFELQELPGQIDFESVEISPYGTNQDGDRVVTIHDDGATLRIVGNSWKKIEWPHEVTPDTILEFDFQSSVQGEIHGIGLDNDDLIGAARTFRLYGVQSFGLGDFDDYEAYAPDVRHYRIPVGQFYLGPVSYLFFVNDHDGGARDGVSVFSNVRVYEDSSWVTASFPAFQYLVENASVSSESLAATQVIQRQNVGIGRDEAVEAAIALLSKRRADTRNDESAPARFRRTEPPVQARLREEVVDAALEGWQGVRRFPPCGDLRGVAAGR